MAKKALAKAILVLQGILIFRSGLIQPRTFSQFILNLAVIMLSICSTCVSLETEHHL